MKNYYQKQNPHCFGNIKVCGTAKCAGCNETTKDNCLAKVSHNPKTNTKNQRVS